MNKTAIVLVLAAAALAACGKQGALERPPPLLGSAAERDYEAKRPVTPVENVDPAATQRSPAQAPIRGTNDPVGRPLPTRP